MRGKRSPQGDALGNEVRALLEPRPSLGLPVPAYGGRSLPNVTSSVVRALGVELEGGPRIVRPLLDVLDPFRGRRAEGSVVVLLVDGFGWFPFAAWTEASRDRAAARWRNHARPITTVFPTTTTAALTSLSTGTAPSQNGVVGYRQFLPRFGVVADLLKMSPVGVTQSEALVGPEWTPELISGARSIFRRGARAVVLSREEFEGTGLTRLLYDGATYVPYVTASDLAHRLTDLLGRPSPPPLIYTYWDELDAVHHFRGPQQSLFDFEADRLAHLLEYVAEHTRTPRPRGPIFLITADHGQVPVDPACQVRVDLLPDVAREMARPLAGDRMAGYFAAFPGRKEALRAALEKNLPRGSRLLPMWDAVRAGLFGPPPFHPELKSRLGDFLVLVPSPTGLTSVAPGATPTKREFLGAHGGLAAEELIVPLVAARLDEFRRDAS